MICRRLRRRIRTLNGVGAAIHPARSGGWIVQHDHRFRPCEARFETYVSMLWLGNLLLLRFGQFDSTHNSLTYWAEMSEPETTATDVLRFEINCALSKAIRPSPLDRVSEESSANSCTACVFARESSQNADGNVVLERVTCGTKPKRCNSLAVAACQPRRVLTVINLTGYFVETRRAAIMHKNWRD